MRILGLDIGSNSVGSAWIDTDKQDVVCGVSVFPAGVEETEEGRGAPKNQDRRGKRSLRRSLARRSARKRALRKLLTKHSLLPNGTSDLRSLLSKDAWELRRAGLNRALLPHEFGRILLHLCQRRGALGLNLPESEVPTTCESDEDIVTPNRKPQKNDKEGDSEAKVKGAVERTTKLMKERGARTFGELIALTADERRVPVVNQKGELKTDLEGQPIFYSDPVRNRLDSFEFHADRKLIRDEFEQLWETQKSYQGELALLLSDSLRKLLDDPQGDDKWRHKGALFGQRRTYWDTGTLGRCDLEPTDRCVPIADRHASYFLVVETVNNLRIKGPKDNDFRPLNEEEHAAVLAKLRSQKTGSISAIRQALKIDKRSLKKLDISEDMFKLNVVGGEDRELNGDWFQAAIVLNAITTEVWNGWKESKKEGLNRAILRFDPQIEEDAAKLQVVAMKLGLTEIGIERLVAAWRTRPKLERRLKMSRRAVLNLLPFMETHRQDGHWPTQIEARISYATQLEKAGNHGTPEARHRIRRYRVGGSRLTKADRHFMDKHGLLPPAPTLSNPVVRKAIHEVRRHVIAHMRTHGGEYPDRIVIEFAREATKPKKLNDKLLFRSYNRNKIRKKIIDEVVRPVFGESQFHSLSHNQLKSAVDRVVLCMQQRCVCAYSSAKINPDDSESQCAYSGRPITPRMAAIGNDLEIDHIIPYSRCGDNSLNNRVLCYRDSNRNKGRHTPREWWGDTFDDRSTPMRFMETHFPAKGDYFERRDYQAKWRNFSRINVANEWKGSQLSDTGYAAREVQTYLQQALWPDELSHLEGGERRILVTKGIYTSILRKDWQLYQTLIKGHEASPDDIEHASLKNRGDHREHAIDAVVIALTDGDRIQELARRARSEEEEKIKASAPGRELKRGPKNPILPPWGDVKSFRKQVLIQLYDTFDQADAKDDLNSQKKLIVVSHRTVGRKLTGAFHEETLFGPIPGNEKLFVGKKKVAGLTPKHLRLPRAESSAEAIDRLSQRYLRRGIETDDRKARKRAKTVVESPGYTARIVDPPPEKSGLVRDIALRLTLRNQIEKRLNGLTNPTVDRNADSFTKGDLARILKEGPLCMPSGVPIKRVVLLRTMNDPVLIPRRRFDYDSGEWTYDTDPRSIRAYVGGNNHHIEIREDAKGKWTGLTIPTYEAVRRVRIKGLCAVDKSDDHSKGGKFVMSLSEGDTVYMKLNGELKPDYFVVFKLDKPQTIQFKYHWDARRAKGEKNEAGDVIPGTQREEFPISATQLKDLAPPGETMPIKVTVDPLGRIRWAND